jgi:ribosomal protein L11 methyltransferase
MASYFERVYRVPAAAEELLTAELWACGAAGFQIGAPDAEQAVEVTAFFEEQDALDLDAEQLAALGAERLGSFAIPERDWLAEYRARALPFEVGRRFRCDPRDVDDPATREPLAADGRILLRIPAQTAFGTGSHESTRLAMLLLEDLAAGRDLDGRRVLDVGTGSGILCFAAEKLGAGYTAGYDIDAPAVCIARLNGALNGCRTHFFAADAAALRPIASFDLLVINELPERILGEYPPLLHCLREGGLLISSGNLSSRRDELLAAFAELGLRARHERIEGEWVAFVLEKSPAAFAAA